MADEIGLDATVEKADDSAACAVLVPTADVVRWFGRKYRVPVVATVNRFSSRTSLSPMGGCHVLPSTPPFARAPASAVAIA